MAWLIGCTPFERGRISFITSKECQVFSSVFDVMFHHAVGGQEFALKVKKDPRCLLFGWVISQGFAAGFHLVDQWVGIFFPSEEHELFGPASRRQPIPR